MLDVYKRQARKIAREVTERKEKQNVRGEKASARKGIPRIMMNTLKDRAEKSTTKLNDIHAEKAEKLTGEMTQIRSSLSDAAVLKTDFDTSGSVSYTHLPYGKGLHRSPYPSLRCLSPGNTRNGETLQTAHPHSALRKERNL